MSHLIKVCTDKEYGGFSKFRENQHREITPPDLPFQKGEEKEALPPHYEGRQGGVISLHKINHYFISNKEASV